MGRLAALSVELYPDKKHLEQYSRLLQQQFVWLNIISYNSLLPSAYLPEIYQCNSRRVQYKKVRSATVTIVAQININYIINIEHEMYKYQVYWRV